MSGARIKTPEQLWYGQDVPAGTLALRTALLPLSWVYGGAARAHRALYSSGLLDAHRAKVPVVAVGNVVAGGAGKTPVVMLLCRLALDAGLKVAVLSRGYGVPIADEGVVVSSGSGPLVSAEVCGDEPLLIARQVPQALVLAGPNRVRLAARAVDELGAQLLILDDGMQHHRLFHNALVAVARVPAPLGNGHLLPAGPLREPANALRAAHTVVLLGEGAADLPVATERLLRARLEPTRLTALDGTPQPLESLRGIRVVAAAGIGRPHALADTLRLVGATVLELHALADHAALDDAALTRLVHRAGSVGAHALVITEKDVIKLTAVPPPAFPVWALGVDLAFRDDGGVARLRTLLLELAAGRVVS